MKRFGLLILVMAALLIGGCEKKGEEATAPVAEEAPVLRLTYANFPPASTIPSVQMERWKSEVEKRTGGKVQVDTFPGGTLLQAKSMMQGVIDGQADIGCLCMSYQPGVFPMTTVTELPLGFASSTVASQVLWDLFEKYQPAEFAPVKVLTMFTSAPSNIMSKTPVRTLADLKGQELRASGIASEILDLLEATPVSMPMSETPEALQKGIVSGLLSSLEVLKDLNFAEYCRYETMTDFQVYPFAVVMNLDRWNALPEDIRKVMEELSAEQARWTGEYMDEHVQESLEWAKETYGIEVVELNDADRQEAMRRVQPLTDAWVEKAAAAGYDGKAILGDLALLKEKYRKQ